MTLHYYYSVVVRKLSIEKNKSVNTNPEIAKNMNFGVETKHVQRLYKGFEITQNQFHALNSATATIDY
ncbi:MAG: hypothetical protein KME38_23550 [Spirirestis rafaelensis WJT71-NPBG6]|jgi:hypothetical protein|nr:hypothetical protein [Spirirestis rafaelensis WJT71-NPBG6]